MEKIRVVLMTRSILFCYAHPDDEIGVVALARRYIQEEDARTTLICATNGDVGIIDPALMKGYSSIAELRLAELERATRVAGFHEVVVFGYRDSGMMGSADHSHPEAFWQIPLEEITRRVAEVMRRVRPQIVITFNTYGAYGHPDHIKMNRATQAAFQLLQSELEHPQKLYYISGSSQIFRIEIWFMRLCGKDPRKRGKNRDMDYIAALEATTVVTTKINVGKYLEFTWQVLNCYISQIQRPPAAGRFRKLLGPLLQGTTRLSRVYPAWRSGEPIEHDLFENVSPGQTPYR
jgi:LmbE family N-acetylglucosaminyl deacetylase